MELCSLIFQKVTFRARKMKKTCPENLSLWNFLPPNIKNFLYFRREVEKPEKQKY